MSDNASFTPQPLKDAYYHQDEPNNGLTPPIFDPYASSPAHTPHPTQINPYAQDNTTQGAASYYQDSSYTQPLQYHLYTALGPHREAISPHQRNAQDFFISDTLREDLQRKSAAAHQVLVQSKLPPHVDHFHSLFALDTTQKNSSSFKHPSWMFKVVSQKDGRTYALRRIEGYRLTNEKALRAGQSWKRVTCASIVTVHDVFTTRSFGDGSLIFVTDYHPLAKTLAEAPFPPNNYRSNLRSQQTGAIAKEAILWSYLTQIANALKVIHGQNLAARVLDPSKILVTDKNRLRLNGVGILDVLDFDNAPNTFEQQRNDLFQLGRIILMLGVDNTLAMQNMSKAMEMFARTYTNPLSDVVVKLLNCMNANPNNPSIDVLVADLASHTMQCFNDSLHLDDNLNTELNRELENSRIVRLMTKISCITERPEYGTDPKWSETGERFPIKLFRDYVFHQVDGAGHPVLDLAHILACLNKLDAGSEEKMLLTDREEQSCLIVTFREMKRAIEGAWGDLMKAGRGPMV